VNSPCLNCNDADGGSCTNDDMLSKSNVEVAQQVGNGDGDKGLSSPQKVGPSQSARG